VGETITAALKTMGVRGRDAMVRQAKRQSAEDAVQEDASLRQGTEVEADTAQGRLDAIKCDQEVLGAFYQHLLAPVEAHLEGAAEVLIIPHKELFDNSSAALFDCKTGQYLIQRCVLRVTPFEPCVFAERGTNGGGRVAGHERSGGRGMRWWWATRCPLVECLCPRQK
jgi:hypothetical protein